MKIAYIGIDLLYPALPALAAAGCHICELFTCETDNKTEFNVQVCAFAKKNDIPLTIKRIRGEDIRRLEQTGCEALICGGYYHRIPAEGTLPMVNIHPSLLPIGRGAWPMPVTILRGLKKSGVTIHKITAQFDEGDILLQQEADVEPEETLRTLTAKLQALLPEMMRTLVLDFHRLYREAVPQGRGEYWPCPAESDYPITPETDAAAAGLILRAFYGYECIYKRGDITYGLIEGAVYPSEGSVEQWEEHLIRTGFPVKGGTVKAKRVRILWD